jgi:hypothetical protein
LDSRIRTVTAQENANLEISPQGLSGLQIFGASWGPLDVTQIVKNHVQNGVLNVIASNEVFSGAFPGNVKVLTIAWANAAGHFGVATAQEGHPVHLQ